MSAFERKADVERLAPRSSVSKVCLRAESRGLCRAAAQLHDLSRLSFAGCGNDRANAFGGLSQRIIEQVRISRRSVGLCMAQECANHRQRHPGARQDAGVGVPEVVEAAILDVGLAAHCCPKVLDLGQGLVGALAGEQANAGGRGLHTDKQMYGRRRQRHPVLTLLLGVRARLGPHAGLEIELVPGGRQDLAAACAG